MNNKEKRRLAEELIDYLNNKEISKNDFSKIFSTAYTISKKMKE